MHASSSGMIILLRASAEVKSGEDARSLRNVNERISGGERLTYSEVENRKKGDVSLKASPRHTIKGKTQTLIDNIACYVLCCVLMVMPLEALDEGLHWR